MKVKKGGNGFTELLQIETLEFLHQLETGAISIESIIDEFEVGSESVDKLLNTSIELAKLYDKYTLSPEGLRMGG